MPALLLSEVDVGVESTDSALTRGLPRVVTPRFTMAVTSVGVLALRIMRQHMPCNTSHVRCWRYGLVQKPRVSYQSAITTTTQPHIVYKRSGQW